MVVSFNRLAWHTPGTGRRRCLLLLFCFFCFPLSSERSDRLTPRVLYASSPPPEPMLCPCNPIPNKPLRPSCPRRRQHPHPITDYTLRKDRPRHDATTHSPRYHVPFSCRRARCGPARRWPGTPRPAPRSGGPSPCPCRVCVGVGWGYGFGVRRGVGGGLMMDGRSSVWGALYHIQAHTSIYPH